MLKAISRTFLITVLSLGLVLPTAVLADDPIKVFIDGEQMSFQGDPVILDGTTMVPFRSIFEKLGLSVQWDQNTQTVTGNAEALRIRLTIGHSPAQVNNHAVELPVVPQIRNNITYVPLRLVAEATGKKVSWDQATKTVYIETNIESRSTASAADKPSAVGLARLEPESGYYFGVVSPESSIHQYSPWLSFTPASYVTFVNFPMQKEDIDRLDSFAKEIAPIKGIILVTLEPMNGLEAIGEKDAEQFAELCAKYEQEGLGIMVRFAHEMNGSWYPWGEKPTLYKEKFRLLAGQVHQRTRNAAMLWAPNTGGGYPFSGGQYEAKPGTPDFALLDTDGNHKLDMSDDMFTPYYPGDDAVDWVGMSVYHWGRSYPWYENEVPEAKSFSDQITGNYNGANGNQLAVPNFYSMFCEDGVHNKPMAIPETAAFYNTTQAGSNDMDVKRAWWRQVFNIGGDTNEALDISQHFPKIKMINWFDIQKNESEAKGALVDWRFSGSEVIQKAFLSDLRFSKNKRKYLLSAEDYRVLHE